MQAKFEPTDSTYSTVWEGLRKTAQDAGIGKAKAAGTTEVPSLLGSPAAAPVAKP